MRNLVALEGGRIGENRAGSRSVKTVSMFERISEAYLRKRQVKAWPIRT